MAGKTARLFATIASLLAAAALGIAASNTSAQTVILERVIAIIDDDVILASEFNNRVRDITESIALRGEEAPPPEMLAQEVLDRMVLERIQLQMGERVGVRFNDAEINEAMSTIAAQSGRSLDQFRLQIEAEGKSYAAVREQVLQELILNNVQQGNLRSRVQVTEQDIDNYLNSEEGQQRTAATYRAAHLMLPLASQATAEDEQAAKQYLEELQQRLHEPGSFEALVSSPPQAPYALSGGDLGWRKSDDLPGIFIDVLPKLEIGELSAPLRSASGYHLAKLLDKRGGAGQIVHQTKVRHILVSPSEIRSSAQARELANSLRKRIIGGEDFAILAREFSEDLGSAQEGGDLGWTNPGQMVPEFEQAMRSTPPNTISEAFETQFGWHFLEVLDERDQDVSLLMQRRQAHNIIYQERFEEELQLWLRKIRDEAFVDIKL